MPQNTDAASVKADFKLLNARIDGDDFQKERQARIEMIQAARKYYDGDHPHYLKIRKGEKDHNIVINLCKALIRKSVAWLFGDFENGDTLKFSIKTADNPTDASQERGPADNAPEADGRNGKPDQTQQQEVATQAADQWLSDVWEANGGAQFMLKMGRRTSIAGHGFIKILPADDPANDTGKPKLILLKSELVSVIRRQDDDDTAEAFVIEWIEKRLVGGQIADVKVRQIITRMGEVWVFAQFNDTGQNPDNRWIAEIGPDVWRFAWCPIVDWQNTSADAYYGESDLGDLPVINNALNFTASNVNKILYTHGHPRTVGTGFAASALQDTAVDAFWTIENENAKVQNLEMQSDLASAFSYLQFLQQSFWDIGRDVDLGSLRDRIGQVTNFGLRVLANSAISKLGEKRLNYGKAINQINRIMLELGGHEVRDTEIHWINPLPEDSTEEVDRLQKEIEMEITSRQTAAEERGRDWEQEQERIEKEKASTQNIGGALLSAFEKGSSFSPMPAARQRLQMQQQQQRMMADGQPAPQPRGGSNQQ